MSRDCTQYKDFSEHVYQRLRSKYKDFMLPHMWSSVHRRNRETNCTYLLRAGLETPNSQASTPRLFSPNWGKQNLIRSLTYKPSSLRLSLATSLNSPFNSNAMLSTQFNSSQNSRSIPLFTNDTTPVNPGSQDIECNTKVNVSSALFDIFGEGSETSSITDSPPANTTPFDLICNTPGPSSTLSLNEALSRTIESKCKVPSYLQSYGTGGAEFRESGAASGYNSSQLIKKVKSKKCDNHSSIQEPFKNFLALVDEEKTVVQDALMAAGQAAIALSYSDNTSHLGIGSSKPTYEKITVSGICLVFKIGDEEEHFGVFVPVSSSYSMMVFGFGMLEMVRHLRCEL